MGKPNLTHNLINPFKNDPWLFWPTNPIDPTRTQPNSTQPARFAMSTLYQPTVEPLPQYPIELVL